MTASAKRNISSDPAPVTTPCIYYLTATFSGPANTELYPYTTLFRSETSTVNKATPTLSTTASNGTAGGTISDTAHFSGLVSATGVGTVTFNLYEIGRAHV